MILLIVGLILLIPVVGLGVLSLLARKPDHLGVRDNRLSGCPSSPNCVSTRSEDEAHRIEPLPLDRTPEASLTRLREILARQPRVEIRKEEGPYLHAEATSLIFRFVDDLEFLLDRQDGVIHFRSASRVGHSDLGANRARMERIRQDYAR